ncbi:hypothetical protein BIY24_09880 [Halobacteriovorax marinus]|uniref:hypothetical protein n=1 Tax=Halobacteriovorax marinus TaxID=97084 RepID=UPI000BC35C67|nr:hypothetical protein [Halobacteriovorax marinus]ATH08248.1 hypothetical protein BIY24_09880 [Halobacteriovorax marinus]
MKYFFLITLLCSLQSAHAKREIIKISNLNITTQKKDGATTGQLSATELDVDFGGNKFKARDGGKILNGSVEIKDNKFKARVSFVTYDTELAPDNPLVTLDQLFVENAQINFDKEEMFFTTKSIKTGTRETSVSAIALQGSCDPKGDASTDIDIVCLNHGDLEAQQAQLKSPTTNILTHNFRAFISPDTIALDSNKLIFSSNNDQTGVERLKANCNNGIKKRFSIDDFIAGCIEQSHIFLDEFSEVKKISKVQLPNKALVDLEDIKYLKFDINNGNFDLRSKIKIFFRLNLKVLGTIEHLVEEHIIKLNIDKASIAGIPAKTLTLMILKLFMEEDSIRIEGDTIYIAL